MRIRTFDGTKMQRVLIGFTCVLLLCAGPCFAQDDEMTSGEMLKKSLMLMGAGKNDEASWMMKDYLEAVKESRLPRVISISQDVRFKLATILVQSQRLDEAAEVLEVYVDTPLAQYRRQGMKMLGTCYYEIGEYENAVKAILRAIEFNKNPVEPKEIPYLPTEEEGAEIKKKYVYEKYINWQPEEEFTKDELIMLHLTLGESYFNFNKWAECIEHFEYVIDHTPNQQRKGFAIMWIIKALIEIPDYDRIAEWVPELYRTPARYDIRVNLALMNAAAALNDEGYYDSALPLYRMILPRDELLNYHQERMRKMRMAIDLPPEADAEASDAEKQLFGEVKSGEDEVSATEINEEELIEKPTELIELEQLIATLKNLPPYENDIDYRMALIYEAEAVERYWEAVKFFDVVFNTDPKSDIGERSIYQLISDLLEKMDEQDEAEKRGFKYMSEYKEGITPRLVAYAFTVYYYEKDDIKAVKKVLPYIDGFVRINEETGADYREEVRDQIARYDAELYYLQAIANLKLRDFPVAEASFKRVLDEFPGSRQEGNCRYWYGMTKLFQQKYTDGLAEFERYINDFPDDDWVDESYYQGGVCIFGLEKYDEAKERFTYVIETYPETTVLSEAYSRRGELHGFEGGDMLDKAIDDYQKAIEHAERVNQATHPTFQIAEIFEAEERFGEIYPVVNQYLNKWEDEADVAKALFWIGKTKIQERKIDEAVSTYLDAIVKYGKDVRQDGVDKMIAELVKIADIWLEEEDTESLRNNLRTALLETDDSTLQLRLRVIMAQLNETEVELGIKLLEELPDLETASPPVLAIICEASAEMEDYSRAEELVTIFLNKFEESECVKSAFQLRARGQFAEQDFEGALDTIKEVQERYGTAYDVAWAQLMKARTLYEMGRLDEALKANKAVLNVPAWRGASVAQATYQLGQVEEKAGRPGNAHAFYQRVYVAYKAHARGYWAAESYLAAASLLEETEPAYKARDTYRAMLFDRYVNKLPQADVARQKLGATQVAEIEAMINEGNSTNITVSVETEEKI